MIISTLVPLLQHQELAAESIMHINHEPGLGESLCWGRCSYITQHKAQEVVRILSHLDAQYYLQLQELEHGPSDEKVRREIKQRLKAAHRSRREPYVKQLEELRKQQRDGPQLP